MKVLCIVGSPRKDGNTNALIGHAASVLNEKGIETEIAYISDYQIAPCTGCRGCFKEGNAEEKKCVIQDDFLGLYNKMKHADGLIVGSPTYFGSATPNIMALLDRAGYLSFANGRVFDRKVGGTVAIARKAGHCFTNVQLLQWFMINGFIVPGSLYWNIALAGAAGARDLDEDEESVRNIKHFAGEMAWLLEKLHS
jgi:multimeric flavodoxin WrbA